MIETAAALIFAHFLADFVFQTDWIIANKRNLGGFTAHVIAVALASWACLGFPPVFLPLAILVASHALLDVAKLRMGGPGLTAFLVDQLAHLGMALLVAQFAPGAYAAGLWATPELADALPAASALPQGMIFGAGLIATVQTGGYAIAALMSSLDMIRIEGQLNVPRGGMYIGRLERLLIFMLALTGHIDAIGFLITAKSLLRFKEIATEEDRAVTEYIIIGTLASFAWGLALSLLTGEAIALAGPATPP
jgi:hypothetical protein